MQTLISDEVIARATLFAAIEGGSKFWSYEIDKVGPIAVLECLKSGIYAPEHHAAGKIAQVVRKFSGTDVLDRIHCFGASFITPEDSDWPIQLRDLTNQPIGLVLKGQRDRLSRLNKSISIVGSRNPTAYGIQVAELVAEDAVDCGWSVVSGGALGIDGAAHRGCIAADGVTFAVLGGGINKDYPISHTKLFEEISQTGLLISEVMPDVSAVKHRFLTRNRLIAALSKATVVIEAAARSGSIRTAHDAAELMRLVMAIPGSIFSPMSQGTHNLISQRCAEMVTSPQEVMELVMPLAVE